MTSYQVLARKWRPRNFQELVGQTHVLQPLVNALDTQRLHHAYLFTGTRGVGKTTIARIIAKCLNCLEGVSSKPCGKCTACTEIDQGRFIDLIEVDAASRTKVEDTRDLLDNVQYAPTRGRYKVYLIDEVHMLSGHSFNALLKTLEEPPEHVKFLLATTDPKRLPITVLSRCLQFHLKNLSPEMIAAHLENILQKENIPGEPAALQALSHAAHGSVRDALSLLDQAISYGNGHVRATDVAHMLGTVEQQQIQQLLSALAEKNIEAVINTCRHMATHAIDFGQVLEEVLSLLHQIAVIQVVPDIKSNDVFLEELAKQISPEDIQLWYQIGLIGKRDLPLAPSPLSGFEMVMVRMLVFRPPLQKGVARHSSQSDGGREEFIPPTPEKIPPSPPLRRGDTIDWPTLLPQLQLTGLSQTLASHCSLITLEENRVRLLLAPTHTSLLNPNVAERIEQALTHYFKRPIKLKIDTQTAATAPLDTPQQKALETLEKDPGLQMLLNTFDATIQPSTITHKTRGTS